MDSFIRVGPFVHWGTWIVLVLVVNDFIAIKDLLIEGIFIQITSHIGKYTCLRVIITKHELSSRDAITERIPDVLVKLIASLNKRLWLWISKTSTHIHISFGILCQRVIIVPWL
jgi:hypothetical protein